MGTDGLHADDKGPDIVADSKEFATALIAAERAFAKLENAIAAEGKTHAMPAEGTTTTEAPKPIDGVKPTGASKPVENVEPTKSPKLAESVKPTGSVKAVNGTNGVKPLNGSNGIPPVSSGIPVHA